MNYFILTVNNRAIACFAAHASVSFIVHFIRGSRMFCQRGSKFDGVF